MREHWCDWPVAERTAFGTAILMICFLFICNYCHQTDPSGSLLLRLDSPLRRQGALLRF